MMKGPFTAAFESIGYKILNFSSHFHEATASSLEGHSLAILGLSVLLFPNH